MTGALKDRTVIVTGAAQGLGAAIARRFAAEGAKLALVDYNGAALAQIVADCGRSAIGVEADLSDAEATRTAIARIFGQVGRVDTLIHNAAILIEKPFADEDFQSFFRTVNVGLQAGYQLAHALWPRMVEQGGGSLAFVSSRFGVQGFANESAYCAAKHALEGFSKSLAMEGTAHGITSNTITPGMYMNTPMSSRTYSTELRAKWVNPARLTSALSGKTKFAAGPLRRLSNPILRSSSVSIGPEPQRISARRDIRVATEPCGRASGHRKAEHGVRGS